MTSVDKEHVGRVAVVTGAARGLGHAIARELASRGAFVVLTDVDPAVDQAAAELQNDGFDVTTAVFDVGNASEVRAAFALILAEQGPIDILVNNAGIKRNADLAARMDPAAWDREVAVNLSGAFYCTRQVLGPMIEQRWGRIISISSIAGLMGLHGAPAYAATKAGLLGFTKAVALEGYRAGVTANAVCPGVIAVDEPGVPNPNLERMLARVPGEAAGTALDVSYAVAFLASERASFITGVDLPVDAGARLFYTASSRSHDLKGP